MSFRFKCWNIGCTIVVILLAGCRRQVEVEAPFTSLNAGNVYTTDATAAAVLTDIYAEMSSQNNPSTNNPLQTTYITSIPLFAGLGSDELTLFNLNNQTLLNFYRNDLNITSQPYFWNGIYSQIFACHNAIEGLSSTSTLTPLVKQQLIGEAKFVRAFCYFYLVNLYDAVPLVLNTDYKINALLPRADKDKIYQQIISDLVDAENLLSSQFLKGDALSAYSIGSEERVRPTKWAAAALLARVYLFTGAWSNAEEQASIVISDSAQFNLITPDKVFGKNNREAIWQLQPIGINTNANTGEGKLFVLPLGGPNTSTNPVYLSSNIVNSFETGDTRKSTWVGSVSVGSTIYYYSNKYKIGNITSATQEYSTILRLAEQYLIRSEARAQQNKTVDAVNDLNLIRSRASLSPLALSDKSSVLSAILQERKVELFTEWGHRWFDLKRTNNLDNLMLTVTPQKGGTWRSYQRLYPIPQYELDKDPNLIQNPGY